MVFDSSAFRARPGIEKDLLLLPGLFITTTVRYIMLNDLAGNPIDVGDFLVYATKTEAPSLQFGFVTKIDDKRTINPRTGNLGGEQVIYLEHADVRGVRLNKFLWQKNPATGRYENMDTGKVSRTNLRCNGEQSARLMKTYPI